LNAQIEIETSENLHAALTGRNPIIRPKEKGPHDTGLFV
jgi:hypothetical protein